MTAGTELRQEHFADHRSLPPLDHLSRAALYCTVWRFGLYHPLDQVAVFRQADMNGPLPYDDDYFDAVVSIDGIEHIERPFDFIRQCARILRNQGWLILSTPNVSSLRSRWRWFLTGFHNKCKSPLDETRPEPRHHIGMLSFPEARYLLHGNGFRITEIRTNRIKAISWCFAAVAPVAYVATSWVFAREETDRSQRRRNREILAQMFSLPVLFGETMILAARCEKG